MEGVVNTFICGLTFRDRTFIMEGRIGHFIDGELTWQMQRLLGKVFTGLR